TAASSARRKPALRPGTDPGGWVQRDIQYLRALLEQRGVMMSYQRDFERRIRIGLVGAGKHAYRNLLPALHYLPVTLTAICDLDLERAQSAAREYGVKGVYQK